MTDSGDLHAYTLLTAFKSCTCLPPRADQFSVVQLCSFLHAWDAWWRELAVARHGRPDLLYNREVALDDDLYAVWGPHAGPVIETCRALGLAVGGAVLVESLLQARATQATWLSPQGVTSLNVVFRSGPPAGSDLIAAMHELVEHGISVTLSGCVTTIMRTGLLDDEILSGVHLHLIPTPPQPRGDAPQQELACAKRLRLVIGSEGVLYPCVGLVGVSKASLGNASDHPEHTALASPGGALTVHTLFDRGPSPDHRAPASAPGLGDLCGSHRAWLLSSIADPLFPEDPNA